MGDSIALWVWPFIALWVWPIMLTAVTGRLGDCQFISSMLDISPPTGSPAMMVDRQSVGRRQSNQNTIQMLLIIITHRPYLIHAMINSIKRNLKLLPFISANNMIL